MHPPILDAATRWRDHDPDPTSRQQLTELIDRWPETEADLAERFAGRLQFGTAGLRGPLGPGTMCMNRALVRQTTAGLAAYLLQEMGDGGATRGVVVGYDGRILSKEMAEDAAGVLAAAGLRVYLIPRTAPTPLVAFAVLDLGAAAGIVVTASHNPPEDNGFKVYWGNGAQIIPPHDTGIAGAIEAGLATHGDTLTGNASAVGVMPLAEARNSGLLEEPGDELDRRYLDAVQTTSPAQARTDSGLGIVYTPLHGVGRDLLVRAFDAAGFSNLHVVPAQAEPDGRFPTVRFPNPEEPGALDLAVELADETGADLVLANDPDADRLAVAIRDRSGALRLLDGNQVGVLLGEFLLSEYSGSKQPLVVSSIVSSSMLARIAESRGARHETVLTGFKWIANRAMEIEADGEVDFIFGFEEALGYTVGTTARDKDGIGAALAMAELAERCRESGTSVLDRLEALYRDHGHTVTRQKSVVLPGSAGAERIRGAMDALRNAPPEQIGGLVVETYWDVQAGRALDRRTGVESALPLPGSNLLRFHLERGATVTARPSGTEPKIKFYFEGVIPDGETDGESMLDAMEADILAQAGLV